jgi:hypothetical protein
LKVKSKANVVKTPEVYESASDAKAVLYMRCTDLLTTARKWIKYAFRTKPGHETKWEKIAKNVCQQLW